MQSEKSPTTPFYRKRFSKTERDEVYAKCGGRCAYCGCEITIKEMQIDHIKPILRHGGNEMENLLPACRQCNFYKSTMMLEPFRYWIGSLMERVSKPFIFRLAKKYGMVKEMEWNGKFYFETLKGYDDD